MNTSGAGVKYFAYMMKLLFAIMGVFFIALCACAQTAYYVSSSSGDDSNAGTKPDAPWKTLEKMSKTELKPGDSVLLKAGDTWRESFFPKGSGTPEKPILISSYGEGAKPHIAPGRENVYGIRIVNAGGYKIYGLEFSDCYGGIVTWTEQSYDHKYLWIEDCHFHDITGKDTGFSVLGGAPLPVDLLYGMGVSICGSDEFGGRTILSDITIKNCKFDKCDVGIEVIGRDYDPSGEWKEHGHKKISNQAFKNVNIIDCEIRRSYRTGGVMLYCTDGGTARNVLIDETGYEDVGMWWGVAAFQCARVANYLVEDCTFSNTIKGNSPDGQGFDFEADCQNITLRNCKFIDNDGPAILWFGGTWAGSNRGNVVENCVFEGNNRRRVYDDQIFMVWHPDNEGVIRNSTIRQLNEFQTFSSYPIKFDASNKIYSPDGKLICGGRKAEFEDDFSNGLGNWELGANSESINAKDGKLALPAGSAAIMKKSPSGGYFFEADITLGESGDEAGIIFRAKYPEKYFLAKLVQKDGFESFLEIVKHESGNETGLRKITCVGVKPGEKNRLAIELAGNFVKVRLDGNLVCEFQDDSSPKGKIGLWGGNAGAVFENVKLGRASLLPWEKADTKPNYAKGATVTATSEHPEHPAQNAADRKITTFYRSAGTPSDDPQTIYLEMPKANTLNKIVLYPAKEFFPMDFEIALSGDGESWESVVSEQDFPVPQTREVAFKFNDTKAKYVRLSATKLRFANNQWTDNKNVYIFQIAEIALTKE